MGSEINPTLPTKNNDYNYLINLFFTLAVPLKEQSRWLRELSKHLSKSSKSYSAYSVLLSFFENYVNNDLKITFAIIVDFNEICITGYTLIIKWSKTLKTRIMAWSLKIQII